jgi:hypothetical protein
MRHKLSLIEQLCFVSVKIHCKSADGDEEDGTGSIISDGSNFYVITAGHCIKKNDSTPFNPNEITVTLFAGNNPVEISVTEVCSGFDFSGAKDYATLKIDDPHNEYDYYNHVKRCDVRLDEEEFFFYGYTKLVKRGRKFNLKQTGKDQWHLVDDQITNQNINPLTLMEGNSGAGVFFSKSGVLYNVGYIKQLLDIDGTYNDIIVYSSSHFDDVLSAQTKEDNLFSLVQKWTEMENEEIDAELKETYENYNVDYMDNLERKMNVLYSNPKEALEKLNVYLDYYLKGLALKRELGKSPYIDDKLNSRNGDVFQQFKDERSSFFNNSTDARQDMKDIKKQIMAAADETLKLDDIQKSVSKGFANYSIAEKLLICSLDYKKEI